MDRIKRAESFLFSCIRDGLACSYDVKTGNWVKPYPEVTGYLVTYFSKYHERIPVEIDQCVDKMIRIQHPLGGFSSFADPNLLYVFDTAKILEGLCEYYKRKKNFNCLLSAINAGDFLIFMQFSDGKQYPVYDVKKNARRAKRSVCKNWGGPFSALQCKNVEGLLELYYVTKGEKYKRSSELLYRFSLKQKEIKYTHPAGYAYEGFLAMGNKDVVKKRINKNFLPLLHKNGYIPFSAGFPYAYVSGTMQLGILMYKTGMQDEAYKVLNYGRTVQDKHPSGGLFQYADENGDLDDRVHTEINSWGTKYFCELERLFANDKSF